MYVYNYFGSNAEKLIQPQLSEVCPVMTIMVKEHKIPFTDRTQRY